MMIRNKKRIWALFLSAVMIVTQLPAVAMAENSVPEDGAIASFEALDSGVANQTVDVGTELSGLNLPDMVTATIYHVTEDTIIPDKVNGGEAGREGALGRDDNTEDKSGDASIASPSDAGESISGNNAGDSSTKDSGKTVTTVTTSTEEIPVTWDSEPAYDGDAEGKYVFTADVGGYALSSGANLPQITVTVSADTAANPTEKPTRELLPCTKTEGCTLEDGHEGECVITPPAYADRTFTINGFADFYGNPYQTIDILNTDASNKPAVWELGLPGQMSVYVGTEIIPTLIDVDWKCTVDYENTSLDSYTFVSVFNGVYQPASSITVLPEIQVNFHKSGYLGNDWKILSGILTIDNRDGMDDWLLNGGPYKDIVTSVQTADVFFTFTIIPTRAFSDCPALTTVSINSYSIKTIGDGAFANCGNLKSVEFTDKAPQNFGSGVFDGAHNSFRIYVPKGATGYDGENWKPYANRLRITGEPEPPKSGNGWNMTPEGLLTIENDAGVADWIGGGVSDFNSPRGQHGFLVTEAILKDGVTTCPSALLGGLKGLEKAVIPDSVTEIPAEAFKGCSVLEEIVLGKNITAIGSSAFYGCSSLKEITIPENVNTIGDDAFSGCAALENAELGKNLVSIGNASFYGCGGLKTITIPDTVTSIGDSAFFRCGGLKEMAIPANVDAILHGAFGECTNLATVRFFGNAPATFEAAVFDNTSPNLVIYIPKGASGYSGGNWEAYKGRIRTEGNGGGSGGGSSESGGGSSGGGSYSEPEPQSSYTVAGENISRSVSRTDLKKLADDRKSLTLRCDKASMTFGPAAMKAILAAVPSTAGNITFSAVPADLSAFPDAAKLIGAHPVYDFTISYKDSKGNAVKADVNFPAGSASITLNYTPAAAEVTGSLFMVYVDGKGAVTWLDKSSYDSGKVLAEVPHFSTYGVAYKAPVPVFTDIANHWAKADMEFVAARGLLSGTENNLFSPDGAMTRGMFVTALGRLAGVNPDSYKTRSFTDVKADAYYAAYVEWAAQKNIVKGTGEGLFSPDAPVTREQMAVMMVNYAGQMGYTIPTPLAAVTFADNDKISTWAAKEVAAMQRAGIIKGKDGNRFDPQASATRAEVSAVLRRFVEIVIDPVTAQGWVKNDSGQWLCYKAGKALTGWKQIGGKWYYFDKNGVMAVNTKVDGYEIGPDGARKDNN